MNYRHLLIHKTQSPPSCSPLTNAPPKKRKIMCSVWRTDQKSLPLGGAPSTRTEGKVGHCSGRLLSEFSAVMGGISREIRCWGLGEYLQEPCTSRSPGPHWPDCACFPGRGNTRALGQGQRLLKSLFLPLEKKE